MGMFDWRLALRGVQWFYQVQSHKAAKTTGDFELAQYHSGALFDGLSEKILLLHGPNRVSSQKSVYTVIAVQV